jgi:hypothetical protein
MFGRLLAGFGRDDSGGEQHNVEGFRREFAADADRPAHRGQIGRHERQPGSGFVAQCPPDHGDVGSSRQGLLSLNPWIGDVVAWWGWFLHDWGRFAMV